MEMRGRLATLGVWKFAEEDGSDNHNTGSARSQSKPKIQADDMKTRDRTALQLASRARKRAKEGSQTRCNPRGSRYMAQRRLGDSCSAPEQKFAARRESDELNHHQMKIASPPPSRVRPSSS
jgi:hypothetical protein